jgi:signal transduction histidine kinase
VGTLLTIRGTVWGARPCRCPQAWSADSRCSLLRSGRSGGRLRVTRAHPPPKIVSVSTARTGGGKRVSMVCPRERLAPQTETTAYFIVAEALTNVAKHARATEANVSLTMSNGSLVISVQDNGEGGADPSQGTGLTGLLDRIEATNGTLLIISPEASGTTVRASLPALRTSRSERSV